MKSYITKLAKQWRLKLWGVPTFCVLLGIVFLLKTDLHSKDMPVQAFMAFALFSAAIGAGGGFGIYSVDKTVDKIFGAESDKSILKLNREQRENVIYRYQIIGAVIGYTIGVAVNVYCMYPN